MSVTDRLDEIKLDVNFSEIHAHHEIEYDDNNDLFIKTTSIVVPIVFSIIFVIGIIGNGTLVFIVLRNKAMRTKPNILIVCVALGDFLLILISVPFKSTLYTTDQWYFGDAICKLTEFMQTLSLGVSVFSLAALSVDRFIAIVYPLTAYSSTSLVRVVAACIVIWIVSIGFASMDLVGANVQFSPDSLPSEVPICYPYPTEWTDDYETFRKLFHFLVFFVVPMIVILCLYTIIAVVLLRQSPHLTTADAATLNTKPVGRNRVQSRGGENLALIRQIESRKKVAKVVLSFVVIFVVCWLPRHVYVLYYHFADFEFNAFWYVYKISSFCLMFIYSSVNPLALYLLNEEYRRYFRHYLFGWCYKPWQLKYSKRRGTMISDTMGAPQVTTNVNVSLEDLLAK